MFAATGTRFYPVTDVYRRFRSLRPVVSHYGDVSPVIGNARWRCLHRNHSKLGRYKTERSTSGSPDDVRAGLRREHRRTWIALTSFRRERGLIVFFPFLKLLIAHSASLDWRERRLVENSFASARICSRYFASTTLSSSRKVSSVGSRTPASVIIERSGPPAQRVDASLPT